MDELDRKISAMRENFIISTTSRAVPDVFKITPQELVLLVRPDPNQPLSEAQLVDYQRIMTRLTGVDISDVAYN